MKKNKKKSGNKVVRKLVPRAAIAMKNEFYLETAHVLSELFESRLKNLITRVEKENPGLGFGLDKCIKRVKYLIVKNPESIVANHFDVHLLDSLRAWKNHRNDILKDMIRAHVTVKRLKKLAEDGIVLFQELSNSNKQFKKEWKKVLLKPVMENPVHDDPGKED